MSEAKKVLLFTNSEYGQANVVLATAYDKSTSLANYFTRKLLISRASRLILRGCNVHIASFKESDLLRGKGMPARVVDLNDGVYGSLFDGKPLTFHPIKGESMGAALAKAYDGQAYFTCGTGTKEALRMYPVLAAVICAWDRLEYIEGVESCVDIIRDVRPDVIVNERLCAQAIDACTIAERNYIILSPNTFKETIATIQPWAKGFWRIPADISGLPFPVPWHLIPLNMYLHLRMIISAFRSPSIRAVATIRKHHGLRTPFPYLTPYEKQRHYIIPSALECDFKFSKIPTNVTSCGPILLESPNLSVAGPELEIWLQQAPTVLINLGTHFLFDAEFTKSMASAVKLLLLQNPDVQVLWKLQSNDATVGSIGTDVLWEEIGEGRIRIEPWLRAEPSALVGSGFIVCSVHHGGANAYFEAIHAGVSQIILPQWFDTFDFAQRVEYLGVGIYGSRSTVPKITSDELGQALITITDEKDERGREIARKAEELGKQIRRCYRGREAAADKIIELAEYSEFCNYWDVL